MPGFWGTEKSDSCQQWCMFAQRVRSTLKSLRSAQQYYNRRETNTTGTLKVWFILVAVAPRMRLRLAIMDRTIQQIKGVVGYS